MYHTGLAKGHHHKGPRNAANKSLLSYRAGHGITGYVGCIPSSEAIPIPTKGGPNSRAGDDADKTRAQPAWKEGKLLSEPSVYQATIGMAGMAGPSRHATMVANSPKKKTGGFLGASGADDKPGNPPFVATTVYNESFSPKKQVVSPVSRGKKAASFLNGTTYSRVHDNTTEMMHGIGWLENQAPPDNHYKGNMFQEVVVQRHAEDTMYQSDFGEFGRGMPGQLPNNKDHTSLVGTTKQLFMGTPKAFLRMPGYQGFVPNSERNGVAVAQATNDHNRPDIKDSMRLFNLQQFHTEIPGTQAFRPKDAANLMAGSKGRMGTNTYFANSFVADPKNLATLAAKRSSTKQHGSRQETKKFFQGGKESVSENGIKNAEAFYKLVRPYEGIPRICQPSLTSESGYLFGTYSDRNE